jgi:demethylmenaquinone methyltransferase/2-methoxy-6-polyprenyl-1,4-benzoquinol methylase
MIGMVVDKSGERVRRMFAEISGNYDRMNHLLSANIDRYWRWTAARRLKAIPPGPVLDVCTGTGDLALALWKRFGGRATVVGTDFCRPMLDLAEQKKQRRCINDTLSFVEADTQELPFADNHFQLVTVAFGLRNVTDTERGLRELYRVCQPGGQLGIREFSIPRRQPVRGLYQFYFRRILPNVGQLLARNSQSAYCYLPESVGEFPSGSEMTQQMARCGWKNARFIPLTLGIATLYVGEK